jgi:hypothetical protein
MLASPPTYLEQETVSKTPDNLIWSMLLFPPTTKGFSSRLVAEALDKGKHL